MAFVKKVVPELADKSQEEVAQWVMEAASLAIRDGVHINAHLLIIRQDKPLEFVELDYESEEEKIIMFEVTRRILREHPPKYAAFFSEAWLKIQTTVEYDGVPPSESPDRIDSMLVLVGSKDGIIGKTGTIITMEGGTRRVENVEDMKGTEIGWTRMLSGIWDQKKEKPQ